MKYPEFVKSNDTLGFVAPSFGVTIEPYKSAFENALKKFKELGFQTKIGPNVYRCDGVGISSTPENCGRELTDFYLDSEVQVMLSVGGGELMCEVVPYIDFEKIKAAEPKWFLGYSDNTNFNFLLPTLCDVASLYGPNAPTFGMEPWHESVSEAFEFLKGERTTVHNFDKWEKESLKDETNPLAPYNVTEKTVVKYRVPESEGGRVAEQDAARGKATEQDAVRGKASSSGSGEIYMEGRLLGGCVDCLLNLAGTRFDKVKEFNERYKEDGIIWFLESCDLNPLSLRRGLWELREAGWFDTAKGFLIGRPFHYGENVFGLSMDDAMLSMLQDLKKPVIYDLDFGHLPPQMMMVQGAVGKVTLSADRKFEIKYEWK